MQLTKRVLASMLNGATVEQIAARRPDWPLLALRVAHMELERLCASLACDLNEAKSRPPSKRDGE